MTSTTTNPIKNTKMYWLQAITPLHVGAGKGVGFIDMPIMREKVTNWPFVPGSAVKGVVRDYFTFNGDENQKNLIDQAFGKEGRNLNANAASLVLTDAHIVCLPVRSLYGTFAYVTCPMVLARLTRDLAAAGYGGIPESPSPIENEAFCAKSSKIADGDKIFFEDLDFLLQNNSSLSEQWADCISKILFVDATWPQIFKERFAIISDDCFNFLAETGTEVAAHIKIDDERKIVANRMLWYEESLPAEAILGGIVWCDRVYGDKKTNGVVLDEQKILNTYCKTGGDGLVIQIGGKTNVGKGRVKCLFTEGGKSA